MIDVAQGFVAQIATEAAGLVNLRCEKQANQNQLLPPPLARV